MKPLLIYIALLTGLLFHFTAPPVQAQAKTAPATIAETCAKTDVLNNAILKADLVPLLSGTGPFTFFIPSGQALQQWQEGNPEVMKQVLLNHLVAGRYSLTDLSDGARLTTLGGSTITVIRKKDQVMINGTPVTQGDHAAGNGMMHTISTVMLPPR